MAALDTASLLIEVANVWVGDDAGSIVDLGAVRNVRFTGRQVANEVVSDNRGTILHKVRLDGVVEFDWLEPGDPSKMEVLFKGLVTKGTNAGDAVTGYEQTVNSGSWSYNTFIPFTYQDGDGTILTINSVTGSVDSTLAVNVDYITQQHDDGRWGIVVLDSATVTTKAQNIVINVDYTPAASLTLTGGTSQTATARYVKIIAPSEDNANTTREIVMSSAYCKSDMLLPFVNVENAGDVGVMPVTIESAKGATWTYTDEINAA